MYEEREGGGFRTGIGIAYPAWPAAVESETDRVRFVAAAAGLAVVDTWSLVVVDVGVGW